MPSDLKVLTVGRISIDLYCGQLGADWHAATSFSKAVGGSPTNVAIAAARLGRRAAVFTKVGADPFGEVAIQELRDFGVDVRFVSAMEGTLTPLAFAVLDPPEDPRLVFRREPPAPDLELTADDIDLGMAAEVPVLWISGGALSRDPSRITVERLLAARKRREHTILDLDYRPTFWSSREEATAHIGAAVDRCTIAVGNLEECDVAVGSSNPGEAARRLLHRGVRLAVVKLGGEGVLLATASGEQIVPARAHRRPVRARSRRCLRWRAVSRPARGLGRCAGGGLRQRGRWDRRFAAAVLAGHAR